MSSKTKEEWLDYLSKMQVWINNVRALNQKGGLTEEEYFNHLKYYEGEIARVSNILNLISTQDKETGSKKNLISEEMITSFFSKETLSESQNEAGLEEKEIQQRSQPEESPDEAENTNKLFEINLDKIDTLYSSLEAEEIANPHDEFAEYNEETIESRKDSLNKSSEHLDKKLEPLLTENKRIAEAIERNSETGFEKKLRLIKELEKKIQVWPKNIKQKNKKEIDRISNNSQKQELESEISVFEGKPSRPTQYFSEKAKLATQDSIDEIVGSADKETINVVMLGNSGVGRTAIRRVYLGKSFVRQHLSTIGAAIEEKDITSNGKPLMMKIIDLGGQEFYASIRSNFYRNASVAIIVFDASEQKSFMEIDKWIHELVSNKRNKKFIPFILVANKIDLNRNVSKKEGLNVSLKLSDQTRQLGFEVPYIEVSAKEGVNIDKLFDEVKKIYFSTKMI